MGSHRLQVPGTMALIRLLDGQDLVTLAVGIALGALISRMTMGGKKDDEPTEREARKVGGLEVERHAHGRSPEPFQMASPVVEREAPKEGCGDGLSSCLNLKALFSLFSGSDQDRKRKQLQRPQQPQQRQQQSQSQQRSSPRKTVKDTVKAVRAVFDRSKESSVENMERAQQERREHLSSLLHSASRSEIGATGETWLNRFGQLLWPHVAEHIKHILIDIVEPAINSKLPSILQGQVAFEKDVTLGKNAPNFGDIICLESISKDKVELRIAMDFISDLKATVVALGARVCIANLALSGELSICFGPLMAQPPYFGGLEIYFVNPVEFDLELGGNIIPKGLHPALRSAISGALARFMVLPNRIAVDLNEEDDTDSADLKYSDPIGVLRLTLLRGNNLAAGDVSIFGSASSDPYVIVSLGATHWQSPTVKCTLDPIWGEEGKGVTVDLPFHSPSQVVKFEVYDADLTSSDDLIGKRMGVELLNLVDPGDFASPREVSLDLSDAQGDKPAGNLLVSSRLLHLSGPQRPPRAMVRGAYLAVKVMEIQGLPSKALFPFKVKVVVADVVGVSKGSFGVGTRNVYGALRTLCLEKLKSGQDPSAVAQELGLDLDDVQAVGCEDDNANSEAKVREAVDKAMAERAARNPHFEETLQLLIPDPATDARCEHIQFQLLDRKNNVIGGSLVPMRNLLQSEELSNSDPIHLDPVDADILGRLTLRFLVQ